MDAMDRLIGVEYRWGGRSPTTGLDCYGLVIETRRELEFLDALPDYDDFYRDYPRPELAPPAFLLGMLYNQAGARRLKASELAAPGDVALVLGLKSLALATVLPEWQALLFIGEKSMILPLCALEIKSYWRWSSAQN